MPTEKDFSLAAKIKTARERRGLTATQLADMLNMKGHTYRRYERGEISVKATLLIDLSRHLEMPLDELVGNQPPTSKGEIINRKIHGKNGTKIILTIT